MPELLGYTIMIAVLWFLIFWILGGVFFAIVTLARVTKLRKARFSCLFTLLSMSFAYGAAYSGMYFGAKRIRFCLHEASAFVDVLAAIFGCGILEMIASGGLWFIGLLACGFVVLIVSRAENQSWVDNDIQEQEPVFVEDMERRDVVI